VPTILRVGAYRFFFFSNEGHEPRHVHVESDERYAKFWLGPVRLVNSFGYNAKELRTLREIVEENAALFGRKWDEFFS